MRKMRRTAAMILASAAMAAGGCMESVFRDDADRQVYAIQRQRQREVLGEVSETAISVGEVPTKIGPHTYDKVPPTNNELIDIIAAAAREAETGLPDVERLMGPATTKAAATAAKTQTGAEITASELDDKEELPPLPEFPTPALPGKKVSHFGLDDCFGYGLGHSREYVSRKEDLYISTLNVTLQRHLFEPRIFAETEVGVVGTGEYNDYATALRAAQSVGVRQKLPYGGEVIATVLAQSVSQIREGLGTSESAGVILEARIPLLRGAGMVAQEDLIQAERDLVYEVREFERFRRGFLVTVASQYFDLVNQQAQIYNRVQNAQSYTFIYQRTLALFKAGRPNVSLLDVQRAKQSALQAQADLTNAIDSYELEVDTFKLLLGMPTEEKLVIETQFLSIAPPEGDEIAAVKVADRLRLDLQTMRDRVDDSRRQTRVAANGLLPDLNVNARASIGTDPAQRSFVLQGKQVDYTAGVTLDWGLDRVAERNIYRTSLINLDRAQRSVQALSDLVTIEVRTAVRRVKQAQYLVNLQRNNIALAQRRKAFAAIQFRDGKIDNRDYLDAENALLQAQNSFAQALSGLQIATLQYLRDTDQLRVDASGKLVPPKEPAKPASAPAK